MYGGTGSYPSRYFGQSDAAAEARRKRLAESVESSTTVSNETPDELA